MKLNINIKDEALSLLKWTGVALLIIFSVAFTYTRQGTKTSSGVSVSIDNSLENYFVEIEEVSELLNGGEKDYLTGSLIGDMDMMTLERNIERHPYVKNAQVYRDLSGKVLVDVEQKRPIARIFDREGADFYITETGELVPESPKYTARVPLIEIEEKSLLGSERLSTEYGRALFQLLEIINEDKFWRAQIAGLDIAADGDIILQPQVTKQLVEFGQPSEVQKKLSKLKLFYEEILPAKGWNQYERVSVKYKNQIICE